MTGNVFFVIPNWKNYFKHLIIRSEIRNFLSLRIDPFSEDQIYLWNGEYYTRNAHCWKNFFRWILSIWHVATKCDKVTVRILKWKYEKGLRTYTSMFQTILVRVQSIKQCTYWLSKISTFTESHHVSFETKFTEKNNSI